jgi:hypothetical protein
MKKTLLVMAIVGLSGCASIGLEQFGEQDSTRKAELANSASLATSRVTESSAEVEKNYLLAKDENYAYYAPAHWETANSAIKNMRKVVAKFDPNNQGFFGGPSESEIIKKIETTQTSLEGAKRTKSLISPFLAQVIENVEYLTPQIDEQWQEEFARIKGAIVDVIVDIEQEEKTGGFETRREKIQARLLFLEIKIVKSVHYTPLFEQLGQLSQALIPQSYLQVKESLVQLKETIEQSPRNVESINNLVAGVENDLARANNVSLEVSWINSVNRLQSEDIALRYRNAFEKVAVKLIEKDISSLSFADQMVAFENELNLKSKQQAASEQNENEEQVALIATLRSQLDEISATEKSDVIKATLDAAPVVLTTPAIVELESVESQNIESDSAESESLESQSAEPESAEFNTAVPVTETDNTGTADEASIAPVAAMVTDSTNSEIEPVN